jgi:four helix bundle protein
MNKNDQLSDRLLAFGVRIIALVDALPRAPAGRHIARQLLRAGTSCGANYEEARGAESKRDFIHKLGIVLKELKESRYWIRLAAAASLVKPTSRLDGLLDEVGQLIAIFGKSLATARKKAPPAEDENADN